MSRIVFVNGQYCDYSNSLVHVEDRGYQFADGVYEVFTVINSSIVDYYPHLNRLYRSLLELKIKSPIAKRTYLFHIKNIIQGYQLLLTSFLKKTMILKVCTTLIPL